MRVILFGLVLLLGGCGTLGALGQASRPLDVYELRAPSDLPVAASPLRREVIVELPTATGTLDTDRIMIRPDSLQAQYLPDARWGEEAPAMMQTLLVRALTATGGILYVGRRPLGGGGDFAVVSDLVDFQAEIRDGAPVVRVALNLQLGREAYGAIIASRAFAAEAPADGTDTDQIVAAFDTAADMVLREVTLWTMARLGRPL